MNVIVVPFHGACSVCSWFPVKSGGDMKPGTGFLLQRASHDIFIRFFEFYQFAEDFIDDGIVPHGYVFFHVRVVRYHFFYCRFSYFFYLEKKIPNFRLYFVFGTCVSKILYFPYLLVRTFYCRCRYCIHHFRKTRKSYYRKRKVAGS